MGGGYIAPFILWLEGNDQFCALLPDTEAP